jgi:hypothetical protein
MRSGTDSGNLQFTFTFTFTFCKSGCSPINKNVNDDRASEHLHTLKTPPPAPNPQTQWPNEKLSSQEVRTTTSRQYTDNRRQRRSRPRHRPPIDLPAQLYRRNKLRKQLVPRRRSPQSPPARLRRNPSRHLQTRRLLQTRQGSAREIGRPGLDCGECGVESAYSVQRYW